MKSIFKLFLIILCLGLVQCGSSSDTDSDDDSGATFNEASAEAASQALVSQTVTLASNFGGSLLQGDQAYQSSEVTVDCENGGTLTTTISGSSVTIDFDDCDEDEGTYDGSITLTLDSEANTISIDFASLSFTYSGDVFSLDGTITVTYTSATVYTVDIDNFFIFDSSESSSMTLDAELTYDTSAGTMNGELTANVPDGDGGNSDLECEFTDFNTTTATDEDWDDACTLS